MRHPKMAFVFCTLCISAPVWSSGDDGLWILPAATACLAQYPELSTTRLGTSLANAAPIQVHINRAKAVFASNPWSGRGLCNELIHDKTDPHRDDKAYFNDVHDRHSDELKALAERLPDGWFSLAPRH